VNTAGAEFGGEKVGDVFTDFGGDGVGFGEGTDFVVTVGEDHARDLGRVELQPGLADTIRDAVEWDFAAVGRIYGLVDVVNAAEGGGMALVELDQDAFAATGKGGRGADAAGEHDAAVRGDLAGLDHGPVHGAQGAGADVLR